MEMGIAMGGGMENRNRNRNQLRYSLFAYCLLLVFALCSAYSSGNFMKERKRIIKLCRDVTESDELQLSFQCAKRMKICGPEDKHMNTSLFMGVRIYIYTHIHRLLRKITY